MYFENKDSLQTIYNIAMLRAMDYSGFYSEYQFEKDADTICETVLSKTGWTGSELLGKMIEQFRIQKTRRDLALNKKIYTMLFIQLSIFFSLISIVIFSGNGIFPTLSIIILSLFSVCATTYLPKILDRVFPYKFPGDI